MGTFLLHQVRPQPLPCPAPRAPSAALHGPQAV